MDRQRSSAPAGAWPRRDEARPSRGDLEAALERAQDGARRARPDRGRARGVRPRAAREPRSREACAPRFCPSRGTSPRCAASPASVIRRLETPAGAEVAAERRERVEDLALLVDLIASGWRGVERRLDRLERIARPDRARARGAAGRRALPASRDGGRRPAPARRPRAAGARSGSRGRAPTRGSSSPPSACASSREMASPSPVPPPFSVTNGRKIALAVLRRDAGAGIGDRDRRRGRCLASSASVIEPPSGVQANALSSRLETI